MTKSALLTLLCLILLSATFVSAQEVTPEPTPEAIPEAVISPAQPVPALARARVANFSYDTPPLRFLVNGQSIVDLNTNGELSPITFPNVSSYLPSSVGGTYTVTFVPAGAPLGLPLLGPVDLTAALGHDYTVGIVGSVDTGDLALLIIDETTVLAGWDKDTENAAIYINSLIGVPAVDILRNGNIVADDLEYGDYAIEIYPADEPTTNFQIVARDNPDQVFYETDPEETQWGGFLCLCALAGLLPAGDYGYYPTMTFARQVQIVDGGEITIGDLATVDLLVGSRVSYTLMLDEDALVGITMTGDEGSDAYFYIYDADGTLLTENDEIAYDDEGFDAGIVDYALSAGTYIIEAASWNDGYPGTYALTISVPEEGDSSD